MDTKKAEIALEIIAKRNGVSVDEVRHEIEFAIFYARDSKDPKAQEFWKSLPHKGEFPTPEEVITYIASKIK